MSLVKKIVTGFIVLLLLIIGVGVMSRFAMVWSHKASSDMIDDLQLDMKIDNLYRQHIAWRVGIADALLNNKVFDGELDRQKCPFGNWYDKYTVDDPQIMPTFLGIREHHDKLHQCAEEIVGFMRAGDRDKALGIYNTQMVDAAKGFNEDILRFLESTTKAVEKKSTEEETISRELEISSVLATVIAFIIGLIIVAVIIVTINKVILRLNDATSQITSASGEILAASQEQASGAREQSSAVAETTSAAKELSATSDQVGDSIKRVSQAAAHALAGMAKIKEAISKTSNMITALGEKSQQIGKITELIDDVADQTNLLAVNASIEAARAGEQGRGFTVVADEIRKLADSTAKSTKDITALIELIQHEMSNSIMAMETSVTSIDDEAKLAQQTAESAKEITMSTAQQIAGSKQIAEAMTNIDDAMKQIAAGAQQSQAAAKQLTELANVLKAMTVSLR